MCEVSKTQFNKDKCKILHLEGTIGCLNQGKMSKIIDVLGKDLRALRN